MQVSVYHRCASAAYRFPLTTVNGIIGRCMNDAVRFRPKHSMVDFQSLTEYKKIYGDIHVPTKFEFDQGASAKLGFAAHRLGAHVKWLRRKGIYQKNGVYKPNARLVSPRDRNKLDKMGFAWTALEGRCMRILKSLRLYKKLHDGNLNVPKSFIIPEGDEKWPKSLWGMKLGDRVTSIVYCGHYPQFHEEFKKLGLASGPRRLGDGRTVNDLEGAKIKKALQLYKKLHDGNLNVAQSFIIPEGDEKWPKSLWGMKLGERVSSIVYRGYYPQFHDEFKKLGMASGPRRLGEERTVKDLEGARTMKAVKLYKKLHDGNLNVAQSFIIPQGDEKWPKTLWGMKLGQRVSDIVYKGCYPQLHEEFMKLGVASGSRRLGDESSIYYQKGEKIKKALQVYKKLHDGNLNVPRSFVIPQGDEKWPKSLWGMKFGARVSSILYSGSYPQFHDEFKKLGLTRGLQRALEGEKIKKALQLYKTLHGGNLTVPQSFIIPQGDEKWPKSLWGMKLGRRVETIVYKGHYPQFHDEFMKLGLATGRTRLGNTNAK